MEQEDFQYLADDEPVSKATTLGHNIFIYLDSDTREVAAIVSEGPFGASEYDPEAALWVAMGAEDTWRIRDLDNNAIQYKIDWKNDNDFDENDDLITLKKYAEGTLDEEYLKANTIAVAAPIEG
jgi:hypothetical protein